MEFRNDESNSFSKRKKKNTRAHDSAEKLIRIVQNLKNLEKEGGIFLLPNQIVRLIKYLFWGDDKCQYTDDCSTN